MKYFNRHLLSLSLPLILLLFSLFQGSTARAALNGTYTIDSSQAATATNYKDFLSAVSDLKSGTRTDGGTPNGAGVTGPVVFNVAAGTYPGQLDITTITGVSATNTITFDGGAGNAATRIITYNATVSATRFTVRINNQQYINLRNLTINASGTTYGWPLNIFNVSSNVKVKNCILNFTSPFASHTSANFCALVVNNNATSPTTGTSAINIEIDSNRLVGGYGNYIVGTGANTGILFRQNTIDTAYYFGVYVASCAQMKINGNTVNMNPLGDITSYGINITSCVAGVGTLNEVSNNRTMNCGQYGIAVQGSTGASTSTRSQFFNNAVGGGFRNTNPYGIYFTSYMWDVFHNSVNIDNVCSGASAAAFYFGQCCTTGSTLLDIRNNIFAVTASGSSAWPFYYGSTSSPTYIVTSTAAWNYNMYYKSGITATDPFIYLGGSIQTMSNFIGNGGYNTNSFVRQPSFTSATNLKPMTPCNNGTQITAVPADLNGTARNNPPDIGAYEVSPQADDIGVESITSPAYPFAAGPQNVVAVIRNYGSTTITSATIGYMVNGVPAGSTTFTGSLAPCATATVTFTGGNQYTFIANTPYSIKAFTSQPNGNTDANPLSDTTSIPLVLTSLSGNYTIDQSLPTSLTNFASFTEAANALNYGGVVGPVVFTVMGTTPYNEQVRLANVQGASATNTITFDGGAGNAASRVLTYTGVLQSASHTFRIESTPWVRLRNLTIRGTGTYAWPVHIMNTASSNIQVRNCIIDYGTGPGVTGASDNYTGIAINGGNTTLSTQTSAINIDLDSNTITGGQHGIYIYCASYSGYNIRNNTITNANQNGIYVFLVNALRINNNTVAMRATGSTSSVGISINNCYSGGAFPHEVQNNVITDAGQYGMYLYYFQGGTGTNRTRVANNMVGGTFRSTDPTGVYINTYAQNMDFWFNSVNVDNPAANGTQSAALRIMTNITGMDVRNNNLSVSATSGSTYALYSDLAANFNVLDYNNYFKAGNPVKLVSLQGTNYTATSMKGAQGLNSNSISVNPSFVSAKNLHTNQACNNGVAIAGITTDVDGNTRNNPPDIGADENMSSLAIDISAQAVTSPNVPIALGVQNIKVVMRNNGTNTVNTATVSYQVNGGTPQTISWTGTLNACDSQTVTFDATSGPGGTDQTYTFLPGVAYSIKVYVASPNFTTDMNTANDTITLGPLCAALAGNFTIDSSIAASGTNFTSFTSAVNALTCGGITGPVVFSVAAGTFTGQADITDIAGSSAVNTVTFDGGAGNASTRIINFAATATNALHTIRINSAQNIVLRNLTIRGSGTSYGWPLHIFGSSSNIKVKSCIVDFAGNGLNGTSDNYVGIVVNNYAASASPTSGSWTGSNIEIDSNRVLGGNTSVYIIGNGTATGIWLRNNALDSANTYGAYMSSVIAPKVIANTITTRISSTTSNGLYFASVSSSTTDYIDVRKNRIAGTGQYGINLNSSSGVATSRANMINNSVGGGFRNASPYGISFSSSNYWNVWFNSVNIDNAATGATSAAYFTGSTNIDCRDNNFAVTNTAAANTMYPFRSLSSFTLDYNNYYKANLTGSHMVVNSTTYDTTTYKSAAGGGTHASRNNPGFTAARNLTPTVATNDGIQLAAVPFDINDSTRNNPPDVGAFEIPSGLAADLGIVAVYSPDTFLSSGVKDVVVTVKNFGTTVINSFNLRHTVNGAVMQDSAFTGLALNLNDTLRVTMTGSKRVSLAPVLSTFKVYIHQPNGSTDNNTINDTVTIGPKIPAMNGTYTINPAGSGISNFVSFRSAVNTLTLAGVSGPVTFLVSAATYNEQVNIGAVTGISATNTITFDGGAGNAATRIIDTAANTTTNYWTVKLNNAQYITFRNLTIRASGATYGAAVQIAGTSHFSRFKNCVIEIGTAGAASTSSNYIGMLISNATNIASPSSNIQVNSLEIDSNTFNAGYYGIYAYGQTSTPYSSLNRFRNNTLNNSYLYGMYFYYFEGLAVNNNNIVLRTTGPTNAVGLYFNNCTNATVTNFHTVNGNRVVNFTQAGIYWNGGGGTARSSMMNNMVGGNLRVGSTYGIYLSSFNAMDIFNNSVNMDFAQGSEQYAALYINSGTSIDVRNNILAMSTTTGTGLPLYMPNMPSGLFRLDYNNYYKASTAGNNLMYLAGIYYNTTNYINGGGYNANSLSKVPGFTSPTDLHLSDGCTNGAVLAALTSDIDGQVRNNPPDIGADEVSGLSNDIGIVSIVPFTAGQQDIKVLLKNYGGNTINSTNVSYSVNGSIARTILWTGTLAPCDTVTAVFTGANQFNFALGTAYTLVAYTSNPNVTNDPKTSNDTVTLGPSCTYLSGNYTINPAGSGLTNFTSFTAAAAALNCGGVSGPVVFKVAPGTYNEQITINNVTGASAINTITFDGDSAANRIISFSPGVSTEGHTIRLNAAQYVSIRNLTVQTTGNTFGAAVHILGNSHNAKVKNCLIIVSGNGASSTSGAYAGVIVNNNADVNNPTGTGTQVTNVEIDSNRIVSGYYGIVCNGLTSTPYTTGLKIRNNTIDSSYYYGTYLYYNDGFIFSNNTVNMRVNGSANSQGFSITNCFAQGTNFHTVTGNRIMNAGQYGMYLFQSYSSSSTYRSKCINNMIAGGFRNATAIGAYCQYLNYWDIWHNSVNLDYPTNSTAGSAMTFSNGSQVDLRNNMLVYSAATGSGLPLNVATSGILSTMDYNNYVNNSGSSLLVIGAATYSVFNYQGGGGFNLNSKSQNPVFTSNYDLHIASACINGTPLGIATDIDGQARNTPPDMGADEFIGSVNNDIGVSFIITPNVPFVAGTQDVRLRISNFGANTVTAATVRYSVNGGAPKTFNWSGSLAPCDTTSVLFTGASQFTFLFGNSYTLKAYTEQPNGVADASRGNDTLTTTLCTALSGVYTINPAGSGPANFTSFSAAAAALNCGGVNGPVTFTVSPGTYNEQVAINAVSGASATNTVTIDGGNAANTILTFAATTNLAAHTLRLSNAAYVTVKNLTIQASGASYGNPLHLYGSCNYSKVKNCVMTFTGPAVTSTSGSYTGLVVNGNIDINSPTGAGSYVTGLEIDSNRISYGYYGMVVNGITSTPYANNNYFRNNAVDSAYYYGMYIYYQDGAKLKNNNISMRITGSVSSVGLYFSQCYTSGANFHEIVANKIIYAGQYGVYAYFSSNPSGARGKFMNNMIGGGFRSSSAIGYYTQYSDYWDVWNNSINLDVATTNNQYSAFNNNSYSNFDLRNNHFVYSAATGSGLPFYGTVAMTTLNYNNYYNAASTSLLYLAGTTYTTANYVNGGGFNANSKNVNPSFVSSTNLRTGGCMKGVAIAGVTNDIDGDVRNSPPDIGADESVSNDAGVTAVTSPVAPIVPGLQDVVVVVKNFGGNVINTLDVVYNINGTGAVTKSLTALNLQPCSTVTVTFTGAQQFNFGAGGSNVTAYTSNPNGSADNSRINDTLKTNLCGPLNGTYTINPAGSGASNFTSFTAAVNALNCSGITGPVVFNVSAGTYTEQVDLFPVVGASATNTITFNGGTGNAPTRVLTYPATLNNLRHTLRFNGAQYITVKNITIQATGVNYGWGVHFFGTAHNNAVKNCIIDIAGANAPTSTSNAYLGIVSSSSTTSETGAQQVNNLQIDSNTINNGYYGIILYGNTAAQSTGTLVRGNTINSAYYYGAYLYAQNGFVFNSNTITMRTGSTANTNSCGLLVNSCTATGTSFHEINGNKITDVGNYGMQIQSSVTASTAVRARLWNNMIGGGYLSSSAYGVYFTSNSNWDVFNNSISLDFPTTNAQYAGFYMNSGSGNSVKNNIFSYNAANGPGLPYYCTGTASYLSAASFNYNMFYKAGAAAGTTIVYNQGNYSTITVIGGGGSNFNSRVQNPNFNGVKNLHITDGCFNGDSLGVTTDFDGSTRASYPDMGADEVPSDTLDLGVKVLLQPGVPITPGLQDIKVIIKNYGTNTVYNGTVTYSVNGGTPVSTTFNDTIAPCDTSIVTFTGAQQFNFVGGNTYNLKVYTQLPNGNTDGYAGNDTASTGSLCVGMAGNFTINPAGSGASNFTSFAAAINGLLCGGVSGPVNFSVAAGTYNEQITIPAIPGASAANPVTFDGGAGNAATRILVNGSTTASAPHTVRFSNATYIRFNNLTIRNTSATNAWPVHIYGYASNIRISNSIVEITGAGAAGTNTNFIPIVMSGSINSATTGAQHDSIEVDSNVINGGYASVWDYNSSGTSLRVRGNTLSNPTYYGVYAFICAEVKIKNNTINMSPAGNVNSVGVYTYSSSTTTGYMHEISGNRIQDMGQYGIYNYFSSGSFTTPGQMVNNMIGGGFRNTTQHAGIFNDYSSYWSVWFNSIISDTATSGVNGAITLTNSSQVDVRNNILDVSAVNSQMLPFYAGTAGNVSQLNYNNYYKAGSFTTLIYLGNNYGLSNYAGALGYNLNSFSRDPLFVSSRDLHIGNACNNGVNIAAITTDRDGDTRNNPPDVGADEMLGGVNDNIGVSNIVSPATPLATGSQDVVVIVSNLGNNLVVGADVSYSINGGIPVTMHITDSIQPCNTLTVAFTGANQYTFNAGGSYVVKAYTSVPNGVNDNNHADDTTTIGPICPAMSGAYTIDPAGSGPTNFTSFTAAVNALQCGGVNGAVNFSVANAVYNEQVSIGSIAGVTDSTRVTFTGASQSATILSFNAISAVNAHTVRINNSPYIGFYNMTIQSGGSSYGVPVHILGSSHYARVKNCNIRITGAGATSTGSTFIPVLINNTSDVTNPTSAGSYVINLEIDSNKIQGGYYSVLMYGRTSTPYTGSNKFRKNTMDSAYYYGLYAYYSEGIKFLDNVLNMRMTGSANSMGLYLSQCYNTGTSFHDISRNRITGSGQYGAYMFITSGLSGSRSKFVNNMVGGGFRSSSASGLYWQIADYWDVWNNTVNLDYPTAAAQYAAMQSGNTTLDIRNNIFAYTATSGTGLPFYSSGTVNVLNYNNYYNAFSTNLLYVNGTTYTSSTYVGGGGYNANSVSNTSSFIGQRDLHVTAAPGKGVTIPTVPTDLDGEVRQSPPDLGADEYYSSMDIGVVSIDSPATANFCGTTKNLVVKIKNYGNQPILTANIDIFVNGSFYNTYFWTGSLGLGATSPQINIGTVAFNNGIYAIDVVTRAPNSGTDINAGNDSAHAVYNVTATVVPTVSIAASATSICSGMPVTFTATISNGGTTPAYQWRKNGITVGTNSNQYSSTTLADGDSVICILTSTAACATPPNVISNYVKMIVGTSLAPDVTIAASATTVCAGSSVTFTATPVNGGTPHYQWKLNGANAGTDSNIFVLPNVANNDSVSVVMTSSLGCAIPPKDTSNSIRITVNPLQTPSVSIVASLISMCSGAVDTFTATPVNGGTSPVYQWHRNSSIVGTNNPKFITTALNNNDSVWVTMTSNATCATPATVSSGKITLGVTPTVTPTITVSAASTTICTGTPVTFSTAITNGGSAPHYQWKKNGVNVGTDSTGYTDASLSNHDTVYAIITSNAACATDTNVTSNKQVITVNPYAAPDVTIAAAAGTICAGGNATFTATPVNGGATPHYQWRVNGTNAGTDNASFSSTTLANNDAVSVIMTSSAACISKPSDTSNTVTMTVNPNLVPDVTITSTGSTICAGSNVTFTATPVNGGTTPHYQWKVNGANAGTDSASFSSTTLANNAVVSVIMTSGATCLTKPADTSNAVTMTVNPNLTPTVSVNASTTSICSGSNVTFTATITNGGSTPHYQWKVNGTNAGTDNAGFASATLNDHDSVYVVLTSNATCLAVNNVSSNKVVMTVTPTVTPVVTIAATTTNACAGAAVTFTATTINGGTSATYQWKKNGVNVGTNNPMFNTSTISNQDTVYVLMTSTVACAVPAAVTSNKVLMTVTPTVTPAVTITASANTACQGAPVTFTANGSNGGTTPSYTWLKNGVIVGTDSVKFTTSNIASTDVFKCVLTSNATCTTKPKDTSATMSILVLRNPQKPVITRLAGDTLVSTAAQGYQWYMGSSSITGATTQKWRVTSNGSYTVKVDSNGCSSTSDPYLFNNVGVQEAGAPAEVRIYPNPTRGEVLVSASFTAEEEVSIAVTDMVGREITRIHAGRTNTLSDLRIDMSDYRTGVYLLQIMHGDKLTTQKIVKAD